MRIDSSAGRTVGRDPELEQLNVALEGLAAGAAACITVEGEPGIGKTHLLTVFRRRAEEAGCLALAGSATEFERELPFSVWVDALDAYVASQELDLGDRWSAELVEELSRVIPSVRPRSDGAPATVADERYRSHRAVRSLLELLADERPLVVVLDDLHWSDEASIELLAGLLQRAPEAPVLLAIAFRVGRAPARLSAALTIPSVRRIRLAQLDDDQATELLGEVDPRAAETMVRHAGGNPFYLEQLKRAREDGAVPGAPEAGVDVAGVSVPAAVAASLADELASLPADELALLRAAAVAGEPFEPDLAGAIAELPPSDVLGSARRAAGARPRAPHDCAAPIRLPAPARPPGGLRVRAAGLEACGPCAGRGRAGRPRGGRRGPCASRRAVRGPGGRTGHRAPPRGRRLGGVARAGGGRPLVRGRPRPAPRVGRG